MNSPELEREKPDKTRARYKSEKFRGEEKKRSYPINDTPKCAAKPKRSSQQEQPRRGGGHNEPLFSVFDADTH